MLDASAATVVPGLIDVHTHGGAGVQVIDGADADLDRLASFYAAHGVTGFLATIGGSREHILAGLAAVRAHLAGPPARGARCLGVHLEGPFISPDALGAFLPESAVPADAGFLTEVLEAAGGHLRLITLAPELDGADDVVALALRHGVVCSIGHTVATAAEMDRAVGTGFRSVSHLFNGMVSFHHREPGVVGAALADPRLVCEVIADGVHVHPLAVALAARAKGVENLVLISDSISATGLPDGEYELEEQHVTVAGDEVRLADGTLAGSTLTLDRAVANLARWADLPWTQAVRSATDVPARLLGLSAERGAISVGRDADLAAFDADHRLLWTMVGGVLHEAGAT
ncbi:N-acetylglucosamine-6-phosphate deacetylase [Nocardioides anomalus]|uniref:N-acetylglucosamine-6-phosphate deacetylase n=1 Tax=Nocardioides anomalus TaxID=2712223 RepID=A0A6G6WE04_9ACTN|nr:N-acetylglucosamine-6-phosphate deacetylase [Nocardioides anomalus]QIG43383.1 N-acetylglucosamine-6-phosphate deacetylase [Nocardioides anomalus]